MVYLKMKIDLFKEIFSDRLDLHIVASPSTDYFKNDNTKAIDVNFLC